MKDLIILGAGPAGLSASVYASRYKIDHLLIGAEIGGFLNEIHKVENYLGFDSISGMELGMKMKAHAEKLGGDLRQEVVQEMEKIADGFRIKTNVAEYEAKKIIYSIGTSARKLGVEGERDFLGKGISYCATCDGPFFRNKKVVVVGGGNSAAMAALMLAEHASSVVLVHRGAALACEPSYLDGMERKDNIEIRYERNVVKVEGENLLQKVFLSLKDGTQEEVETDGLFIEIGSIPNQKMIKELGVETDERGFVVTSKDQKTSIDGLYAAGDITTNSDCFRQIITAASEGAIAAVNVFKDLK